MQSANLRYLVLAVVLAIGAGVYALVGETHSARAARWPDSNVTLEASEWSTGPLSIQQNSSQTAIVSRSFQNQNGATAVLSIVSSAEPKLYAAGAEVPFLGTGYAVQTPGRDLVPTDDHLNALLARRGAEQWLVLYAYGERRGLLGNGPGAWGMAIFDGITGHDNDYYKLYLATRADNLDPQLGQGVANLARAVFPQVAEWYATPPSGLA
jgi:hypothetical protein